jgi:hypothetical protein
MTDDATLFVRQDYVQPAFQADTENSEHEAQVRGGTELKMVIPTGGRRYPALCCTTTGETQDDRATKG